MADMPAEPPLRPERPESYHAPAHLWTGPPGLPIRPHFLARRRQQSATGPATDGDEGDRDGRS